MNLLNEVNMYATVIKLSRGRISNHKLYKKWPNDMAIFKNHTKDILHHFYGIILYQLTTNIAFMQNTLSAWILNF